MEGRENVEGKEERRGRIDHKHGGRGGRRGEHRRKRKREEQKEEVEGEDGREKGRSDTQGRERKSGKGRADKAMGATYVYIGVAAA